MNREERRKKQKELRHLGYSKQMAKAQVATYYSYQPLDEGCAVRINYDLMIRHKEWKQQTDEFKQWVELHKNDLFHVEYDENKKANSTYDLKFQVHLKEDKTDPKWLFNSETLVPVATARIKLNSGEEKTISLEEFGGNDPNVLVNSSSFSDKINDTINEMNGNNNEY